MRGEAAVFRATLPRCGLRMFSADRVQDSVLVWVVEWVLATRHPFAVSALREGLTEVSVCVNRRARNSHTGAYGSEDLSPSPQSARHVGMRTAMYVAVYTIVGRIS